MAWYEFQWTNEIIEHLAEHGITPEDFEYVVSNPDRRAKSRSSGRPMALGETPDGRFIVCVFEWIDDMTIEPVTGYEPDNES